jgi:hypothetical protein
MSKHQMICNYFVRRLTASKQATQAIRQIA